ncbi:sulfotransferase domain-containing protein [Nocardioides pelophilus]|uniref:sulfotransferase domain-containing protein n=1 Tax=Nocardioides pelophilus TaxID=2172019 RepID=UPI001602BA6D|nr:sulfotransferase domain-containing protein [Nocardioides pelophilus]
MNDVPNSRAVLVACMPKSGSTYVTELLAQIPGFRREHIVPSYFRREQELSDSLIRRAFDNTNTLRQAISRGTVTAEHRPRGWVAQNHVKHNAETQTLIDRYGIVPVFLVRNIFDVVVSLRDHVANTSPNTPVAYIDEEMGAWEPERMHEFLVEMAVPWYIHFYVSWYRAENKIMVRYEDLIADPSRELRRILKFGGLGWNPDILAAAVAGVAGDRTRKNVGVAGRGSVLSDELKARIHQYCGYYPSVDFSPIGIEGGRG